MSHYISLKKVVKNFGSKNNPIIALHGVDLEIQKGSFTLILGRSGSGKSTLLNLIAGLDKISSGELIVNGKDLSKASSNLLAKYRSTIGIIFQSYNLLPNMNASENVMFGCLAGGFEVSKKQVQDAIDLVGLSHRSTAAVNTLSGGEKQRVAIARSLINNPEILFCDEPTGALDSQNEKEIMQVLHDLNKKGLTIVIVSHNPDFERFATRVIKMQDGEIIENVQKNISTEPVKAQL